MFIAVLFITAWTWKQPRDPSVDDRETAVHSDNGTLFNTNKWAKKTQRKGIWILITSERH